MPKAVRRDERADRKRKTDDRRRRVNATQERARGKRRDERNRHDECQQYADGAAINRHGVTPRFVERVEQFGDVVNLIDWLQCRNRLDTPEGKCSDYPRRDADVWNDRRRGDIVAQGGRGIKPRPFFRLRFDLHQLRASSWNNIDTTILAAVAPLNLRNVHKKDGLTMIA
jgi:hypothetical protein